MPCLWRPLANSRSNAGRDRQKLFADIVPALGSVFGIPHLTIAARITGLLSFV
jgi:hypothetical protein